MRAIELFAGAGGAALGLEAAGVHHLALCEWDPDACATLRAAGLGPVVEGDVRDLDAIAQTATERPDLLWSSFPCQAFSTAGKRLGAKDDRNGWPWTVAAIDRLQPRWFLAENVRGLLCHRGDCDRTGPPEDCPGCYFHRVILEELRERHRRRVICYAGDKPVTPPRASHGPGMFTRPWVSMGEALGGHGWTLSASRNTDANPNQERPVPSSEPAPAIGGGRNQMRERETGRDRLTVAECATLQGFEDHPWQGTKTAQYRQVGNAVPPKLAQVVVEAILEADRKP
jgi:DNA (cytosine-5)-methyltransferase 1